MRILRKKRNKDRFGRLEGLPLSKWDSLFTKRDAAAILGIKLRVLETASPWRDLTRAEAERITNFLAGSSRLFQPMRARWGFLERQETLDFLGGAAAVRMRLAVLRAGIGLELHRLRTGAYWGFQKTGFRLDLEKRELRHETERDRGWEIPRSHRAWPFRRRD